MSKTQFKVGQIWLNKDGDKRIILSLDNTGIFPVVARSEDGKTISTYTLDGYFSNVNSNSCFNLVSLYTPKRTLNKLIIMYQNFNGEITAYEVRDTRIQSPDDWRKTHSAYTLLAFKKITITEGEGLESS